MPDAVVRWGLVGTRGYAERVAIPAIAAARGAQLVGLTGSDPVRAIDLAATLSAAAYASVEHLVADDLIDAVWICSPSYLHVDHAQIAILAGKHVVVEKPLALSATDAWALTKLAAENDVVLATGYQARYVPGHQRMRDLIADGAIGEVTLARTMYGLHRLGGPRSWRADQGLARWGVLADIGTHHLDLLRMLLGEVAEVAGMTARQRGFAVEDASTVSLVMAQGALASVTVTGGLYRPMSSVEVLGSSGALIATDTSPDGQGPVVLLRDGADPEILSDHRPDAAMAQIETISAALRGHEVRYATGADGARNIEILEAITG